MIDWPLFIVWLMATGTSQLQFHGQDQYLYTADQYAEVNYYSNIIQYCHNFLTIIKRLSPKCAPIRVVSHTVPHCASRSLRWNLPRSPFLTSLTAVSPIIYFRGQLFLDYCSRSNWASNLNRWLKLHNDFSVLVVTWNLYQWPLPYFCRRGHSCKISVFWEWLRLQLLLYAIQVRLAHWLRLRCCYVAPVIAFTSNIFSHKKLSTTPFGNTSPWSTSYNSTPN